jgi:DNA-binding NarL/FixJ family response regulator
MLPQPRRGIDRQDLPGASTAISVLIVSWIRIYREGLALALARPGRVRCAGTAATAAAAAAAARSLAPDVAVVDVTMPDALPAIRGMPADVRTVALGVGGDDRAVVRCAELGVAGYLTRDDSLADVAAAVEAVARGEALCPPEIGAALLRRVSALGPAPAPRGPAGVRLTAREIEIVELIGQGLANKAIARRLCIELATVKNHVHNVFEKLGVSGRDDAVVWLRAQQEADAVLPVRGRV